MKNLKILMLVASLFCGTVVFAKMNSLKNAETSVNNTVVETARPLDLKNDAVGEKQIESVIKAQEKVSEYIDEELIASLKACEPMNEDYDFEFLGFDIHFGLKVPGWKDGKCVYKMTGKVKKISEETRKYLNIKASNRKIAAVEPKLKCEFEQKHLDLLAEVIKEEEVRSVNQMNQILSDPKNVSQLSADKELTLKEQELMEMFMSETICSIENLEEVKEKLNKVIESK